MKTVGSMMALMAPAQPGALGSHLYARPGGGVAVPVATRPRYTVKAGDNIAKIAYRFRTTPAALVLLNPRKKALVVMRGTHPDWTRLDVGEVLSVPGARPGVLRSGWGAVGDDDCDPGYEIGPDGSCVFAGAGQPCGNGGVYDSNGQCQNENEAPPAADPRAQQILDSGIIDKVRDAVNAGLTPGEFCASLSSNERGMLSVAASWIAFVGAATAGITLGISAFLLGQVGALAQACAQGALNPDNPDETPTDGFPDDQIKDGDLCYTKNGKNFYWNEYQKKCVFEFSGMRCELADGTQGVYDDDGNCNYDEGMTKGYVAPCPPNPGGRPYERFWNTAKKPPRWECILCPEGSKVDPAKGDCVCEKPGYVLKETDQGLRCVPKDAPGKVVTTTGGTVVPTEKQVDKPTKTQPEKSSKLPYVIGALAAAGAAFLILRKKKG